MSPPLDVPLVMPVDVPPLEPVVAVVSPPPPLVLEAVEPVRVVPLVLPMGPVAVV